MPPRNVNMEVQSGRLVNFRLAYIVTQLIGVFILILVASWVGLYLNGFGWNYENASVLFNWHPMCMTLGMIFLYGNSILIYRGFRFGRKKSLKVTHAVIHAFAFLFTLIGLIAVFDSHNYANPPIPNLYSLHSWIGLSSVIIFGLQYVAGFVCFLFPQMKQPTRTMFMPIHIFFGLLGFILAIASAVLGISEKAFFVINDYANLPSHAFFVNTLGILIIVYGVLVVYLVTEPSYKREPLPEDTMLLTGENE